MKKLSSLLMICLLLLAFASSAFAVVTLPAGVTAAFADVTSLIGLFFDAYWPVLTTFTVALLSVVLFKKLRGKVF